MPRKRAVLLTIAVCLLGAAPVSASERSEARAYAAAMEPVAIVTPEDGEALVADLEARSAHVAATCLDDVHHAARRERRRDLLLAVYELYQGKEAFARYVAWLRAGDERLAAIPTRSRELRRGRAARRWMTDFMAELGAVAPDDFCAEVAAWRAKGYKGRPRVLREFISLLLADADADEPPSIDGALAALKRHGATRAQRRAFIGEGVWPELRDPAPDPVGEALGAKRSEDAGARTPF